MNQAYKLKSLNSKITKRSNPPDDDFDLEAAIKLSELEAKIKKEKEDKEIQDLINECEKKYPSQDIEMKDSEQKNREFENIKYSFEFVEPSFKKPVKSPYDICDEYDLICKEFLRLFKSYLNQHICVDLFVKNFNKMPAPKEFMVNEELQMLYVSILSIGERMFNLKGKAKFRRGG